MTDNKTKRLLIAVEILPDEQIQSVIVYRKNTVTYNPVHHRSVEFEILNPPTDEEIPEPFMYAFDTFENGAKWMRSYYHGEDTE